MLNSANRLFCRLDGLTPALREQQRTAALKRLGLLEADNVPIFDEVTQMAAHWLNLPICTLGILVQDSFWLKSAVGLSRLGLMNQLASSRQIPKQEDYSTYVVDSQQPLAIRDTLAEPVFAQSILAQHYGIRSYLGIPLIAAGGECLGTLAVMDVVPHQFTSRDVEFLALSARWGLGEFEREQSCQAQSHCRQEGVPALELLADSFGSSLPAAKRTKTNGSLPQNTIAQAIHQIELRLLQQLTAELRTPLTAAIGMAKVLKEGVLGKLTPKQKEYLEIIHASGQHLNALVEEILNLDILREKAAKLQLAPVNLELLCQQALNSLSKIAGQKRQELKLSLEPDWENWLLDKERVRQAIYYLVMSLIASAEVGETISVHISHSSELLQVAVGVVSPYLADSLPWSSLHFSSVPENLPLPEDLLVIAPAGSLTLRSGGDFLTSSFLEAPIEQDKSLTPQAVAKAEDSPAKLALLLTCYLAESHGGKVMVQGMFESGCRYVLTLPKIRPGLKD